MIKLGLVGEKLGHSLSPKIHTYILEKIGLEGEYSLYEFERDRASKILEDMKNSKIDGFNITIPYKETLFDKLDFVSDEAKRIGAINTVNIVDGISYGYNTDYYGVIKIFKKCGYDIKDKICYILGSGGASKAVIVALKDLGAKKIVVVTRDVNKNIESIGDKFPYVEVKSYLDISSGDVLINSTPVGMYPNILDTPVTQEIISRFKVAVDLIYNPNMTRFLELAKESGLIVENGLSMLIEQAIKAEEIWLNRRLNEGLFLELENYLMEEKL